MTVTLGGVQLEDPVAVRNSVQSLGFPVGAWADLCHSFRSPVEREPGVGHVLIRQSYWNRIADQTRLTLKFTDRFGTSVSFAKLRAASAPTPLPVNPVSGDPVLWLTLEDRRARFRQVAVNRGYNLRTADGGWDTESLSAGTPYTWAGVVAALWVKLRDVYSDLPVSAPALPSTPSGTPESLYFERTNAWDALCTTCQAGGLLVRYDPTTDTVSIIDPAAGAPAEPAMAVRTRVMDTASRTSIPEVVPQYVATSHRRLRRFDEHQAEAAIAESGVTANARVTLSAYPVAAGDPVSNTTYLTAFAGRVRDFWRRDLAARAEPRAVEYQGYQDWCRTAVGLGGYAEWAVSYLAGRQVCTSLTSGPLMRLDGLEGPPSPVGGFFFAQLTSASSPYSWVERVQTAAGVWADGDQTGTNNAYLVESAGGTEPTPELNDIVLMRLSPTVQSTYEFYHGPGGFECPVTPGVRRELIGVYVVKSGANVTDVYQRFQDITTDVNGCETRGTPYCVIAPETCDTSRDPVYYCIDGVCWAYYDGIVPGSYDAGPFSTPELCDAGCPASVPSCTDVDPGTLPASLTLTVTNDSACPAPCTQTAGNGGFGGTLDTIGAETWSATDDTGCGLENAITLNCQSDEYKLTVSNVWSGNPDYPTDKIYSAVSGTLVPFSLTFEIDGSYICGPDGAGNTITIVVTE